MGTHRNDDIRALRRGIELGMSVIDTAEMYGNEDLVGEAVRDCRSKAFIVSKVLPSNADFRGTKRACERSLKRLMTDYIDLYLLHWAGRYQLSETVEALVELQKEGKIRHWGMSNIDVDDMQHVISLPHGTDCATDQVLYNIEKRGIEHDLVPWSARHGIPLMAYTPLGTRHLMKHEVLLEVARRHGVTPVQVMLAWVLRIPGMLAIPKAGSIAHVDENAGSLAIALTDDDLLDIDSAFPPPACKVPMAGW